MSRRRDNNEKLTSFKTLAMIRGDTKRWAIRPLMDNEPMLEEGDTVYFTVKKSENVEEIEIQKIVTLFKEGGVAIIEIEPADTKTMKFGTYRYDIQIRKLNGEVYTENLPGDFVIGAEVTYD